MPVEQAHPEIDKDPRIYGATCLRKNRGIYALLVAAHLLALNSTLEVVTN